MATRKVFGISASLFSLFSHFHVCRPTTGISILALLLGRNVGTVYRVYLVVDLGTVLVSAWQWATIATSDGRFVVVPGLAQQSGEYPIMDRPARSCHGSGAILVALARFGLADATGQCLDEFTVDLSAVVCACGHVCGIQRILRDRVGDHSHGHGYECDANVASRQLYHQIVIVDRVGIVLGIWPRQLRAGAFGKFVWPSTSLALFWK